MGFTFAFKQQKIKLENSTLTIKYGLEKALNISIKEESACTIEPAEDLVNEDFTFTVDNALPLGLTLTEDGTITGTAQEEFDHGDSNTTNVIVSYPDVEDEEISINWEYVKPEITADSSKSIDCKVNEELNTFNYTPEIGPSEFYTDKTKFSYSVGNLPQGVSARTENGTLVISGTPVEEFNETTTVTISYPNAENKELSITWNWNSDEGLSLTLTNYNLFGTTYSGTIKLVDVTTGNFAQSSDLRNHKWASSRIQIGDKYYEFFLECVEFASSGPEGGQWTVWINQYDSADASINSNEIEIQFGFDDNGEAYADPRDLKIATDKNGEVNFTIS